MAQPLIRSFSVPKDGNSDKENEDALAVSGDGLRLSLADGASESIFAGEWARILTTGYVREIFPPDQWGTWLTGTQQAWLKDVTGQPMEWYVEEKFHDGAFATFLGLELRCNSQQQWSWRAVAVGDTCLFQIRRNALLTSFPIETPEQFNSRPDLINSRRKPDPSPVHCQAGSLRPGDTLLLMTDALGLWFLDRQNQTHWAELLKLTEHSFPVWVSQQRSQKLLKNDDTSLIVLEMPSSTNAPGATP